MRTSIILAKDESESPVSKLINYNFKKGSIEMSKNARTMNFDSSKFG